MSDPDVKKIDPFIIAIGGIGRTPGISKQQLVDALTLVINGKITKSWEQSAGMTKEKTELILAKKELSELSSNGGDDADDPSFQQALQDIIGRLTPFKRMQAEEEARKKAAKDAQGGGDLLGGDDSAIDLPEEEYNDYSSSN